MRKQRKQYSAQEKVGILRKHLLEKVPVSELCEEHHLQPTVFYRWQKQLFEQAAEACFHRSRDSETTRLKCAGSVGNGVLPLPNKTLDRAWCSHVCPDLATLPGNLWLCSSACQAPSLACRC